MKVCTFEPFLGCQARSRARLSTFSLLFDRAILFMTPLTVANYRLHGTVMRCAGEISHHTPNNRAAQQRLQSVGIFLQSPIYLFFLQSQSICFAFRGYLLRFPEPQEN